jgi:hypothetical protein
MTDEDEESKRVRQKAEAVSVRKVFFIATHDHFNARWYVETASDSKFDAKDRIRGAAEGASLKEALMNLADKLAL